MGFRVQPAFPHFSVPDLPERQRPRSGWTLRPSLRQVVHKWETGTPSIFGMDYVGRLALRVVLHETPPPPIVPGLEIIVFPAFTRRCHEFQQHTQCPYRTACL
jgi:hypothetical protein